MEVLIGSFCGLIKRDFRQVPYAKAKNLKHLCKQCGNCCIIHWKSFEATHDDVKRWRSEGRTDILAHLEIPSDDPNNQSGTFTSNSCPFLRRNEKQNIHWCAINDTKPFNCKNYPDNGVCEYTKNQN